jgi:RsiW-degrading membrane proteinase PrsW (M82 family)
VAQSEHQQKHAAPPIKESQMKKYQLIVLWLFLAAALSATLTSVLGDSVHSTADDLALAEQYAPVLYFHPEEIFRPQSVDVLVGNARLRQDIRWWFDVNVLNQVALSDLVTYHDAAYFLDVWYGSKGASDYKNYSAHREYYLENLSPEAGGPPVTAYAHVVRDEPSQTISIQYWLFYYYNDWFNKHEGDWEFVQVMLDWDRNPEWVVLSQHHGGTRRAWENSQIENGTHPAAYIAFGSHANYFWGDEIYPNGMDIGSSRVEILDRTGRADPVIPEIQLLPERESIFSSDGEYSLLEWLVFTGNWGEQAFQSDFGGPLGPADKGQQWERAAQWGLEQPLDTDTWYQNRLRVEWGGDDDQAVRISLFSDGDLLRNAEQGSNPAVLHQDPPQDETITAKIEGVSPGESELTVSVPRGQVEVIRYTYQIKLSSGEDLTLTIPPVAEPVLAVGQDSFSPTIAEAIPATWDAPDLVWFAGYLPANQILLGVLLSLAAGILPSLAYAALLYWNDRYEKEPVKLISSALLWGAIPAVLVALVARLFFQLPPGLIGPLAVEALQAGVLTPLIEEILKGTVVVFIAFRFRREFDNILDGIIYGAMVGFGYAMTGNTISFLGAFLLRGFSGLGVSVVVEGLLFGLNHAMYTAIFGAGLGYARLSSSKIARWLVPVVSFLLAVAANASHNLVVNNMLGLTPLTVLANWLGIVVIILISVWSLRRQRKVIQTELAGEISEEVLSTLLDPKMKRNSLKSAQKQGGRKAKRQLAADYQLLAEYAFKKMQHRRFPQDQLGEEMEALRKEINK